MTEKHWQDMRCTKCNHKVGELGDGSIAKVKCDKCKLISTYMTEGSLLTPARGVIRKTVV